MGVSPPDNFDGDLSHPVILGHSEFSSEDGKDDSDGVPRWDLDGDGKPDPEEDTNGDGVVDVGGATSVV